MFKSKLILLVLLQIVFVGCGGGGGSGDGGGGGGQSETWTATLTGTAFGPFVCLSGTDGWYTEEAQIAFTVQAPGLVAILQNTSLTDAGSGYFTGSETAHEASGIGCAPPPSVVSSTTPLTPVTLGAALSQINFAADSVLIPAHFTTSLNSYGADSSQIYLTATQIGTDLISGTWQAVLADYSSPVVAGGTFTLQRDSNGGGNENNPPDGVSANADDAKATVAWNAATGAIGYAVYASTSSSVSKTNYTIRVTGTQSPVEVTGLSNGQVWYIVVTAIYAGGESTESAAVTVTPGASPTAMAIAAGLQHSCAVTSTGTVKCWGYNGNGELGDGTVIDRTSPGDVSGLSAVISITGGANHTCALINGGTLKCWGANASGQLGDGTLINRTSAVDVTGISNAVLIAAGTGHTCALISGGTVKCWGLNTYGQLGDGTTTDSVSAVNVSGLSNVVSITSGASHTCALISGGAVKCWGYNLHGQLGDTSTADRTAPVDVSALSGVTSLSAKANHTCAVINDTTVKCWGINDYSQLGDGSTNPQSSPVAVSGLSGASVVGAGSSHTCALISGGAAKCWGRNNNGQVGDGSTADQTDPVNVGNLGDAMAIAAGESHNCVLISSGAVRCWGDNSYGQLGDGTATNRTSAVQVIGFGVSGSGGGVPPAPVNVSVSNTGSVSWSSVLGATGYVVYASTGSVSKSTYMIRVTSTGSPVDVDGLTAYMYWNFVVTAENAYGEGPESPVVTICVQVPSQPTVLCN